MNHLASQASILCRHLLGVHSGESVLLLWDGSGANQLVEATCAALQAEDARVFLLQYEPLWPRPLTRYCHFTSATVDGTPRRLPRPISTALARVDACLMLHSDMDIFFSPDLSEAVERGTRLLYLPYPSDDKAYRLLPTSPVEASTERDRVLGVGNVLAAGKKVRVRTPAGTDLSLSVGRYPKVGLHVGVAESGQIQVLPAGQVTRIPDDGTAEGTLVIDRSIAADDYGRVTEPVLFHVHDGRVVDISGESAARNLAAFLASLEDSRVYHLTELGLGTNPRCVSTGIGGPTEDTHMSGTVSFALGCDVHIGGSVPAPVHIDMTMWLPTLQVDDHVIVDGGRLVTQTSTRA